MKKALVLLPLAVLAGLLVFGIADLFPLGDVAPWRGLAREYGVANGVAAIVLGSRLYDTLMEVLVFALAMVGVRLTLRPLGRWRGPGIPERGVIREMGDLLFPVIVVFAVYLAGSGHLGPGGGFPAGAIAGSGLLLLALAKGIEPLSRELHEEVLERWEYGAIAGLWGMGIVSVLLSWRAGMMSVVFNFLIAIEVAVGTWVVLHYFTAHRGEL